MIKEINIKGLWNRYDYNINLHSKIEDKITYITGCNGLGKSTILRLLNAVYKKDWEILYKIPYQTFEVVADIYTLKFIHCYETNPDSIYSNDIKSDLSGKYKLNLVFSDKIGQPTECTIGDPESGFELNAGNIDMALSIDACYFISDQRLSSSFDDNGHLVYSQRLSDCQVHCKNNILRLKQFVDNILSPFYDSPFKNFVINEKDASESLEVYDVLNKWGLLKAKPLKEVTVGSEEYKKIVNTMHVLYQEMVNDKWIWNLYKGLLSFASIIESYDFDHKSLEIKLDHGFRFKTTEKNILTLSQLSSGEQHITLMAYELLFNAPDSALVLVDEPETSQHIAWQIDFYKNMKLISGAKNLQCIIATHLPLMFDNDFSLSVDLYTLAHPEEF